MYPHRIRLRGPWYYFPLEGIRTRDDGTQAPVVAGGLPSGVVKLPCRWGDVGFGPFAGWVRFVRHFGLPRQLDPHEHVWLTVAGTNLEYTIDLNGIHISQEPSVEVDITSHLRPRNELAITVVEGRAEVAAVGEVALEIRASAWLAGVTATPTAGGVRVRGEVRGRADGPLDLYAILGRRTVAQATVGVGPFELTSEPLPPEALGEPAVRVELMCGGAVWWSVAVPWDKP